MAKKKYELQPGDVVRLIMRGGKLGDRYEYVRADKNPGYCWIRECGIAPNGKPYAEQRWMPDMLSLDYRAESKKWKPTHADNERLAKAFNDSGVFAPFICRAKK